MKISEKAPVYVVYAGEEPSDDMVLFYTDKEKAETRLKEWSNKGYDVGYALIRNGDSMYDVHRNMV